jgi:hypothetical protein
MEYTAAVAYLMLWAQPAAGPALTEDEVLAVLEQCRIPDAAGLTPAEEDYTPTYWVQLAVAKCWELKAAKAVLWADTTTEGNSVSASQSAEALRNEARRWRKRCTRAVRVV